MASTPAAVAPTNEAVETDGARTRASGWCVWAARVPYRRCGSCASSLNALHPTPVFARTGPLLPSLVTKPERFHATHSTLHKLHSFVDRTREHFSACTLGRRTRGRGTLDKIGIPWPILHRGGAWLGMTGSG